MPVYFVASYDIANPERYAEYPKRAIPLLLKHGAEVLAADYNAQPLEGEPATANIIIRFESEEQALAWYNDPDHQPVKKLRLNSTVNNLAFLAHGFEDTADTDNVLESATADQ